MKGPESTSDNLERRATVSTAVQQVFDVLKEHLGSLQQSDYEAFSVRFSEETDEYIREFLDQIKKARETRGNRKIT